MRDQEQTNPHLEANTVIFVYACPRMPTSIDNFLINSQHSVSALKIIFTVVETKLANLKSPFLSLLMSTSVSCSLSFHFSFKFHTAFSSRYHLVATKETQMNFYKGLCSTKQEMLCENNWRKQKKIKNNKRKFARKLSLVPINGEY